MGEEICQMRNHKDGLSHIAFSKATGKLATCGDGTIKIHDISDVQNIASMVQMDENLGAPESICWSQDGQFLTVSTKEYVTCVAALKGRRSFYSQGKCVDLFDVASLSW